jgi:hypothetical protein
MPVEGLGSRTRSARRLTRNLGRANLPPAASHASTTMASHSAVSTIAVSARRTTPLHARTIQSAVRVQRWQATSTLANVDQQVRAGVRPLSDGNGPVARVSEELSIKPTAGNGNDGATGVGAAGDRHRRARRADGPGRDGGECCLHRRDLRRWIAGTEEAPLSRAVRAHPDAPVTGVRRVLRRKRNPCQRPFTGGRPRGVLSLMHGRKPQPEDGADRRNDDANSSQQGNRLAHEFLIGTELVAL